MKNPQLAVRQDGETVFGVNNVGPNFLDSVAFKTTGLRDETYRADVKVEYPEAIKHAERRLAIKRGLQQVLSITSRGMGIDTNGDGVVDEVVPFSSVPVSSSKTAAKQLDWRVPATAIGIGGGAAAGLAAWRRQRGKGEDASIEQAWKSK